MSIATAAVVAVVDRCWDAVVTVVPMAAETIAAVNDGAAEVIPDRLVVAIVATEGLAVRNGTAALGVTLVVIGSEADVETACFSSGRCRKADAEGDGEDGE